MMIIFFNTPKARMTFFLHITNALMAIRLHAHNKRMRASMQDTIFPCNEMKETFLRV